MKKYFPIITFIFVFSGFLSMQVGLDHLQTVAGPSNKESNKFAYYEKTLKKLDLKSTDGQKISKETLNGPITIINFWASWCQPCIEELPSLVSLDESFSEKELQIIGINADEEDIDKNIKKTVKKFGIKFPIVKDLNGKILEEFKISTLPVSIIYSRGKVIQVEDGIMDFSAEEFKLKLRELIAKNQAINK